jgi:hypothetical protein
MDDQQNLAQSVPQFDLGTPPPPPGSVAPPMSQGQAPGTVVQPDGQTQAPPQDQTLTQLEQAVNETSESLDLPPPPFEHPHSQAATQPMIQHDDPVVPQIDDASSQPVYDLPEPPQTAEPTSTTEQQPAPPTQAENHVAPEVSSAATDDLQIDESAIDEVVQSQLKQVGDEPPAQPKKNWVDQIRTSTTHDDLDMIKQVALQELAPIANELDQAPKERFETLLQLIQATDNIDLIGPALEAAKSIENNKDRAAALLDVVNEVNYLENKNKPQDEAEA